MPHDILLIEIHGTSAVDVRRDIDGLDQAATLSDRLVGMTLRVIADLEPKPSMNIIIRRGVLGFVDGGEALVQ